MLRRAAVIGSAAPATVAEARVDSVRRRVQHHSQDEGRPRGTLRPAPTSDGASPKESTMAVPRRMALFLAAVVLVTTALPSVADARRSAPVVSHLATFGSGL